MSGVDITPDQVLRLEGPTTSYLCPLSANQYGIEFTKFEIKVTGIAGKGGGADCRGCAVLHCWRLAPNPPQTIQDYESGNVVFKISREPLHLDLPDTLEPEFENSIRSVKYSFPAAFLQYKTIRTL